MGHLLRITSSRPLPLGITDSAQTFKGNPYQVIANERYRRHIAVTL